MAAREAVAIAKQALRSRISAQLAHLPPTTIRAQSERVAEAVLDSRQYQDATRLSIYLSMPEKELQTNAIVEHALAHGKQVFVPHVYKLKGSKDASMDMLLLNSKSDYESLKPDRWGIPSLDAASVATRQNCFGGYGLESQATPPRTLDLILVPGVAFDGDFGRLGHGKGYYDRFLQRYQALVSGLSGAEMPLLVALTLDEQLLAHNEQIPITESDYRVDAIVTGSGNVLTRSEKIFTSA